MQGILGEPEGIQLGRALINRRALAHGSAKSNSGLALLRLIRLHHQRERKCLMSQTTKSIVRWYAAYKRGIECLSDVFLLVIRLYWGWSFMVAGWGKLMNVSSTATYFASLGIPLPGVNAVLSGVVESLGGLLLLLGLGSRLVTPVLIFNMIVAYATAHTSEAKALFSHPNDFVTAPPFLHLLTSVIVLIFGPGRVSLDALWAGLLIRCLLSERSEIVKTLIADESVSSAASAELSRRKMGQIVTAAVGGMIAGALLRGETKRGTATARRSDNAVADKPNADSRPAQANANANAGEAEIQALDAQAPGGIQPSLILSDPHVCRGLNTCKGKGKGRSNSCAGRGACATVDSHACNGLNDCKAHGGCGQFPGQNSCQGKGACAVPLKKDTWTEARKIFEKLMSLKQKPIGQPPG